MVLSVLIANRHFQDAILFYFSFLKKIGHKNLGYMNNNMTSPFYFLFDQGGQDIMSMMGQLMKPKKTEITG